MLWFIKQVFIALLSFSGSLSTKCMSLNKEPCVNRPIIIDLDTIELDYYPFIITLDKNSGRSDVIDDLSTKIYVSSKTNDANVKVFNMIATINETKALIKHIQCDFKCKVDNKTCKSNQK